MLAATPVSWLAAVTASAKVKKHAMMATASIPMHAPMPAKQPDAAMDSYSEVLNTVTMEIRATPTPVPTAVLWHAVVTVMHATIWRKMLQAMRLAMTAT